MIAKNWGLLFASSLQLLFASSLQLLLTNEIVVQFPVNNIIGSSGHDRIIEVRHRDVR